MSNCTVIPNCDLFVFTLLQDSISFEKLEAPANEEEFTNVVTELLKEYFEHGSPDEFLVSQEVENL